MHDTKNSMEEIVMLVVKIIGMLAICLVAVMTYFNPGIIILLAFASPVIAALLASFK